MHEGPAKSARLGRLLQCGLCAALSCGWLCAGSAAGAQTNTATQPEDEAALSSARSDLQAGRWAAAATTLRGFIAAHPDRADAVYLLARSLQRQNQAQESLTWFTRAARLQRPGAEDLRLVALDYVLLNDYADALRWLAESLKADPRNSETWYDLARARMHEGDYPAAEKAMQQALRVRPGMVKAEDNLGLILEAENRTAEAAAAYQRAIALQPPGTPQSEQPLLNYGTLLVKQQRGSEAIPWLRKALAIAPDQPKIHEQLSRALDQTREYPEAIQQMKQAIGLDAGNPRLHYQLGMIYRRAGDLDSSKRELQLSSSLYGGASSEPGPR